MAFSIYRQAGMSAQEAKITETTGCERRRVEDGEDTYLGLHDDAGETKQKATSSNTLREGPMTLLSSGQHLYAGMQHSSGLGGAIATESPCFVGRRSLVWVDNSTAGQPG